VREFRLHGSVRGALSDGVPTANTKQKASLPLGASPRSSRRPAPLCRPGVEVIGLHQPYVLIEESCTNLQVRRHS
jgi:hypothetical protein